MRSSGLPADANCGLASSDTAAIKARHGSKRTGSSSRLYWVFRVEQRHRLRRRRGADNPIETAGVAVALNQPAAAASPNRIDLMALANIEVAGQILGKRVHTRSADKSMLTRVVIPSRNGSGDFGIAQNPRKAFAPCSQILRSVIELQAAIGTARG